MTRSDQSPHDLRAFTKKRKQEAADAEKKNEEQMAKILEKHGAIIAGTGGISMNAINRPEVAITLCYASAMGIDAVELRIALFDKFDNPTNGILGQGNEQTFLHQTPIPPKSFRDIIAPIPLNETAGRAKVAVVKYLTKNGDVVDVKKPFVLAVRQ